MDSPYLYAFYTPNEEAFTRSPQTLINHIPGFSNGLDVTHNGYFLIGVEDGNLTVIRKTQDQSPLSISNIFQLKYFTKKDTNFFEIDNHSINNSSQTPGLVGYTLPDTYKYTEILSVFENAEESKEYGFTLFAIDQNPENTRKVKVTKLYYWGDDLEALVGFKNIKIGGLKIKNNNLYISYIIDNGINFKRFYEENYPKYAQEGKSWVDSNTGLPPSAFSYKDGLYDTRLAVFKLDFNNNNFQIQKTADISTVFDNPNCNGQSYGISGLINTNPVNIIQDLIKQFSDESQSELETNEPSIITTPLEQPHEPQENEPGQPVKEGSPPFNQPPVIQTPNKPEITPSPNIISPDLPPITTLNTNQPIMIGTGLPQNNNSNETNSSNKGDKKGNKPNKGNEDQKENDKKD